MGNDAKILVVDDTPSNLEVITETLSSVGYTVATAISGERALKRLHTYLPDLILLDVQMPGIDGFETCRRIKSNPDTANIPIVFITALSDIGSIVRGFSLGAVDYISKPFQELELLTRVKTHLQLRSLTQQLENRVDERTADLQAAMEELQQSRLQLIQSEKMSALGNLVAGIAHEINNPIGFLSGSVGHAQEYVQDLLKHLALYQQEYPAPTPPIQQNATDINLEFLRKDLLRLLNSMQGATDRIISLSTSLRTFSRADSDRKVAANLHEGLDSTLMILKYRLNANEHRPAIQISQEYGELPYVACFPGQLNQVFMNILANAIDVFDEMAQQSSYEALKEHPQTITIQTAVLPKQDAIEIRIGDNGTGIPEDVKPRIFDYLFTTKGIGKGTGLGLAIARQIVEEKHGGAIDVRSTLGQGTVFTIRLPIKG
ncbi:MAG TPA: response regulator [Crinalium sp.]|jgi:signal transduction histidine kinase